MKNQNDIRLALSTADKAPETAPILLVGSIEENLKTASQLGYQGIEIHIRENIALDFDMLNEACEKYSVKVACLVTGRLYTQEHVSLTDKTQAGTTKAIEGMRKYIDIAAKFHADILVGWIRGRQLDLNRSEYNERFGARIKELDGYSAEKGVRILIEGINRYEIDTMNTAQDILDLIYGFRLDNTYAHLDTFHMNIEETDMAEAIKMCGEKLGYIHFADSNRKYPGAGHIDFGQVVKALSDIDYKGYISVECLPFPDRIDAAEMALKNTKKLLSIEKTKMIKRERVINYESSGD